MAMNIIHDFQTFLLYACLGVLGAILLSSLIALLSRPLVRIAMRVRETGWFNTLLVLIAVAVMVAYGGTKPPPVPTGADATFRVTPYVQHPATNAMSLLWVSDTNATAVVEWWPESDAADRRTASVTPRLATELGYFGYSHAKQYLPELVPWQYRVRIEDLEPDTKYAYRVTLPGGETYSNSFRTSPAEFRPVRFVAYSDSETQPSSTGDHVAWEDYRVDGDANPSANTRKYFIDQTDGYASNICTMVSREPDFYVIAGDLAEKGSDQTHWDEFWRHNAGGLNDPAGSTPILAAPGNHEYHGYYAADDYGERGMRKFLSYFEFEPNGAAVEPDRQERFHRLDYGPVAMIFIDTNNGEDYYPDTTSDDVNRENGTPNMRDTTQPLCQDKCRAPDFNPGSEQYRWLEEQLADAQKNKKFTFLVCHQCPFSVGYHGRLNGEKGTEGTAEYLSGAATRCLTNLVFKYGVDAWLCGHDELYEHSRLTGTETLPDGTTRQHELNVYDVGMGGDGLRGCNRTGRPNPYEVYRAHVDAPEVYDANGTLISGGKHYGHMEVNVTTNSDGLWTATLTPAYVFVSSNAVTGRISFERRTYPDELVITNAPPPVPPVEPTCTVKFNANGGSVSPKSRSVTKGKAVGSLPKATRKGYTFKGWYTKKSGGSKIKTSTKVTKNVTYYARWTANKYKIKFHKNGGTGTMKTLSATYGKSVRLTDNAFKRSKYKFTGWAKKKGGKVAYKNKAKVKNLTSKSGKTVTLYAVWKKAKAGSVKLTATAAAVKSAASAALGNVAKAVSNAAAVPSWLVGTFYGGDEETFTTITVSMAGKVSGKVLFADDKWTIVGNVNGLSIDAVATDASGKSAEVVFVFIKLEDGRCRIESEDGSIWAE